MNVKINLGCGKEYKEGWINVDFNKEIKADIYTDLTEKLPFPNDYVNFILIDNVLEHIKQEKFFSFLEELYRICEHGALIQIYVPHYSGMFAFSHPAHYKYFGIGTFDSMKPEEQFNGERYTKARFIIRKEKLLFFHHNLINFKFLSKIPINWLFNFNRVWQQLMERFQIFGFDEIYYELEVYKEKHELIEKKKSKVN